jgi:hypothetical protein
VAHALNLASSSSPIRRLSSHFTLVLESHCLATPLVWIVCRAAAKIIFAMFPILRCEYSYICMISLPGTPGTVRSQAGANRRVHWVSGTFTTAQWIRHRARYSCPPPLSRISLGSLSLSARTPISSLVLQCSLRHFRRHLCALHVSIQSPVLVLVRFILWLLHFSSTPLLRASGIVSVLATLSQCLSPFPAPYDLALSRRPQKWSFLRTQLPRVPRLEPTPSFTVRGHQSR